MVVLCHTSMHDEVSGMIQYTSCMMQVIESVDPGLAVPNYKPHVTTYMHMHLVQTVYNAAGVLHCMG